MQRSNKLKLAVTSLATILLIAGGGCDSAAPAKTPEVTSTPVAPIAGFMGYDQMEKFGFKFQAPEKWEKDESTEDGNHNIAFYAPFDAESDDYRENFVMSAITIPADEEVTLNEIAQASHDGLKKSVEDAVFTDTGESTLAGQKTQTFTFTGSIDPENSATVHLKGKEFYVIKGNHAYSLAFTAQESEFAKFQKIADQIFSSVEFK